MEQQTATPTATRPTLLSVLCILSWIAQGCAAVIYLLAIAGGAVVEGMASAAGADTTGTGNLWMYLGLGFASVILGFIGVLNMWKLKKAGLFMYIGAVVISNVNDVMYEGLSIFWAVVGGLFIALYAMNLKHMK